MNVAEFALWVQYIRKNPPLAVTVRGFMLGMGKGEEGNESITEDADGNEIKTVSDIDGDNILDSMGW